VQIRLADYDRPETLVPAFAGADKLLLVPSAVYGQRFPQMARAIKAALEAKVGLVAYAGFINSDSSTLRLGDEHKQTEAAIRAAGVPSVMLRNGAYIEVYAGDLGDLGGVLQSGVMVGAAGDGKISGASRADFAEAAAVVLTSENQAGKVYELAGTGFTMSELAATVGRLTGKPVVYQNLPEDQYAQALADYGVPQVLAEVIADTSAAAERGDWYSESNDLPQLIGRPSRPFADVVRQTLQRNGLLPA
jgi:NAD(P)H dehydrogenase (quinone)